MPTLALKCQSDRASADTLAARVCVMCSAASACVCVWACLPTKYLTSSLMSWAGLSIAKPRIVRLASVTLCCLVSLSLSLFLFLSLSLALSLTLSLSLSFSLRLLLRVRLSGMIRSPFYLSNILSLSLSLCLSLCASLSLMHRNTRHGLDRLGLLFVCWRKFCRPQLHPRTADTPLSQTPRANTPSAASAERRDACSQASKPSNSDRAESGQVCVKTKGTAVSLSSSSSL